MIAPDTPIYNQYQAVFFARRAVILAKIGLGTRLISITPHHPSTTPITPSTTTYHPSPLPPHTSLAAVSAFFFAFSASFCCFLIAFFERGWPSALHCRKKNTLINQVPYPYLCWSITVLFLYPMHHWFHSLTITASPLLYRAAVFGVTGCKSSVRLSVIFHFVHKNARQENSKFYSNLRNASS